jgi:hypothetical protein
MIDAGNLSGHRPSPDADLCLADPTTHNNSVGGADA